MPAPTTTQSDIQVDPKVTDTKSSAPLLSGEPPKADATPAPDAKTQADAAAAKAVEDAKATAAPQTDAEKEAAAKADADKKAKEESEKKGAPEKYEAFKAPEGVTLDPAMVDEFSTIAKSLNLSQEDAQKIADLGPKLAQKQQEALATQWAKTRETWRGQLKSDTAIGGNKFDESNEVANRAVALAQAHIPELKGLVDQGWLDHPALFKAFHFFGLRASEGKTIDGSPLTASDKSAAQRMFPTQGTK